jgi:hypothetical protein
MDIGTGPHPERPEVMIMLLVRGDEEVELARWHEDAESPQLIKAGACNPALDAVMPHELGDRAGRTRTCNPRFWRSERRSLSGQNQGSQIS